MNILITGSTGLVGAALGARVAASGHRVVPLRRRAGGDPSEATWNPEAGRLHLPTSPPLDAVVHLAGETIAQRWTAAAKTRIRTSRVDATRLLSQALADLTSPPRVIVGASATGFYGDRGDEVLDEQSGPGRGFLAEVCQAWEAAADPARQRGIRVVHLRLGIVLAAHGGALPRMLPPFRLGLGGRLGSGRQYWSWIALEDVLDVVEWALRDDNARGVLNAVAPETATNADWTTALARALRRPAFLPVPAFVVRGVLGEMGREALLASARVRPARLLDAGFAFRFPALAPALNHLLRRGR
ncbi:MAG: TIGR01777 family oxidoreductase [Verrucomicrobia bacterium]|nr:TIGR01777 family oxidoreductase [Verrucomicrobiota bacterium]